MESRDRWILVVFLLLIVLTLVAGRPERDSLLRPKGDDSSLAGDSQPKGAGMKPPPGDRPIPVISWSRQQADAPRRGIAARPAAGPAGKPPVIHHHNHRGE